MLEGHLNAEGGAFQGRTRIERPLTPPGALAGMAGNSQMYAGLTAVELRRLTNHDIVLLIDKSGSMSAHDCPPPHKDENDRWNSVFSFLTGKALLPGWSRWDWCCVEATNLGKVMSSAAPQGLSVVLFASAYRIFPRVSWNEIPMIFNENRPGGGTNLAAPLNETFSDYFDRRRITGSRTRPLAIGIITDGCPTERQLIAQEIIDATAAIQNPREISITFFLIGGHDSLGERFVWNLDNNLVSNGARYDIVNAVPFNQVVELGLPKALAQSLE